MSSRTFLVAASIESVIAIAVSLVGLRALRRAKPNPKPLNAKILKAYPKKNILKAHPDKPLPFIVQTAAPPDKIL
jgi:hypothetical protein